MQSLILSYSFPIPLVMARSREVLHDCELNADEAERNRTTQSPEGPYGKGKQTYLPTYLSSIPSSPQPFLLLRDGAHPPSLPSSFGFCPRNICPSTLASPKLHVPYLPGLHFTQPNTPLTFHPLFKFLFLCGGGGDSIIGI